MTKTVQKLVEEVAPVIERLVSAQVEKIVARELLTQGASLRELVRELDTQNRELTAKVQALEARLAA